MNNFYQKIKLLKIYFKITSNHKSVKKNLKLSLCCALEMYKVQQRRRGSKFVLHFPDDASFAFKEQLVKVFYAQSIVKHRFQHGCNGVALTLLLLLPCPILTAFLEFDCCPKICDFLLFSYTIWQVNFNFAPH